MGNDWRTSSVARVPRSELPRAARAPLCACEGDVEGPSARGASWKAVKRRPVGVAPAERASWSWRVRTPSQNDSWMRACSTSARWSASEGTSAPVEVEVDEGDGVARRAAKAARAETGGGDV